MCLLSAALEVLLIPEEGRIAALALGREGYTAAQYAAAAVQLLDAKHHAVAREDMQLLLGRLVVGAADDEDETKAAGDRVLQRLVEVNALSTRPKSFWAQDIPAEAFEREKTVVTAPSAMDLFCIGRLRPRLDKTLERWQQKQQVGKRSNGLNVWVTLGAAAKAQEQRCQLDASLPRLPWHSPGC